jgi:hypothetical protein
MKKLVSSFCLIIATGLFLFNTSVIAQNQDRGRIDKVVVKLQQKVLLSDDQAAKVKSILGSYYDGDKGSEKLVEAQRKIESLLDDKQKAKYEIIKADWWKNVTKSSNK